jgi:hypothetical protein
MGNGRKKGRVRPSPVPPSPALKFSFKHLDAANPKYSVQKCCVDFYRYMVRELMRYKERASSVLTSAMDKFVSPVISLLKNSENRTTKMDATVIISPILASQMGSPA